MPMPAFAARSSAEHCGWPEDAARELSSLPLEGALQLVHLYAERGSPKYERAALRWLERYLTEGEPRLQHFAEVCTGSLSTFCGRSGCNPVASGLRRLHFSQQKTRFRGFL
jgi:hypothetical protein